jgi:hypothetical protein
MPSAYEQQREAIIKRKAEAAVAPWRELPEDQITILLRLAEEHYRYDPVAVQVIDAMARRELVHKSRDFSRKEIEGVEGLDDPEKGADGA